MWLCRTYPCPRRKARPHYTAACTSATKSQCMIKIKIINTDPGAVQSKGVYESQHYNVHMISKR